MSISHKAFVAFWIVTLSTGTSRADPEEAEHLFNRGVTDLLAGRYALACPALEQSYDLDPRPGVMFTLAECMAGAGRLAAAFDRYSDFRTQLAALPSQARLQFAEREDLAIKKMQALNDLIPDLTIDVARGAPADLVVTSNGKVVETASYGARLRLDPGDYVIEANSSGVRVWQRRVELGEKAHARVVVPWPPPGFTRPSRNPRPKAQPSASTAERESPSAPTSGRRTLAIALGGVGLAGFAVGGVSGALALSRKDDVDRNCPNYVCNAKGHEAVKTAQTAATLSTVGVGVGVAGLTGALAVWFLADEPAAKTHGMALTPIVTPTAQGLRLELQGALP
jgi:hypothetical protein